MSTKVDRDVTETCSRFQFATRLRRLADAIEADNGFTIEIAGEQVRVPARAEWSIEHERSDGEEEVEFQLTWKSR
jgi:amphi-Trp domain-containing protein